VTAFDGLVTPDLLRFLFVLSVVSFAASVIAIPMILIRVPEDYFSERRPRTWFKDHHPVLRLTALALKNLFGAILLLGGLAMLILPGQGLLTMLIGISLMDFPGKRAIEQSIIGRPLILKSINRIRQRFGRPPLIVRRRTVQKT
jgi:hypothetical protein